MSYNVFDDELDVEREEEHPGYAVGGTVVGKRIGMEELGATLYVLPPGNAQAPYAGWRILRDGESVDYWDDE